MSLRAAIRANVLPARLSLTFRDEVDVMQSAQTYLKLAQQLIFPPAPTLVAVGGLSGTGKSVLARASRLMSCRNQEPLCCAPTSCESNNSESRTSCPESAYQSAMTGKIYDLLVQYALRILVQGHSVVDGIFAQESERAQSAMPRAD